ncbi:MAG: hypothetical protein NZ902_02525 [Acidilobaceae archaeon]|nr:hypothetical protein [Acidilobaceae archaeon]MCX8165695.1 hypothetical protein [Acidilobaceae archaeon]MDW7974120.1 hypothetical protein [Sulfolobales archaeon]
MRLVLLTPLPQLSEVARALQDLGYDVKVIRVTDFRPASIARALEGHSYDYALVPGSSPYDYSSIPRVVKGTVSAHALPFLLKVVSPDSLSPSLSAEKAVGERMKEVAEQALRSLPKSIAFSVNDLEVPARPPPMLLASDVYHKEGRSAEETAREAEYRVKEGADLIVLSADLKADEKDYLKALEEVMNSCNVPVAADAGGLGTMIKAMDLGAPIGMSLSYSLLHEVPKRLRERPYVVIPERMGSWRERVEELSRTLERARELGYEKIIIDPVVNPPVYPGTLQSFIAASELANLGVPILLGLNNAVELMDVDTHASVAALVFLAAEAGVSIVMVGEESYKARGNTREGRNAIAMAMAAMALRMPPKDIGYNALVHKKKRP